LWFESDKKAKNRRDVLDLSTAAAENSSVRLVLAFAAFAASAVLSFTTHAVPVELAPAPAECVQYEGPGGGRHVAVDTPAVATGTTVSWKARPAHVAAASICHRDAPGSSQIAAAPAGDSPASIPQFRRFPLLI
jgi:hypothetical protein